MSSHDFRLAFTVPGGPDAVFDAITDVRSWWEGDIDGSTVATGDVFTYRHEPQHRSTQRVTEAIPGERIVWRVEDADLTFVGDRGEWNGTEIVFELAPVIDGTEIVFTHRGLVPTSECYEACSTAWTHFVGESLRRRLTSR